MGRDRQACDDEAGRRAVVAGIWPVGGALGTRRIPRVIPCNFGPALRSGSLIVRMLLVGGMLWLCGCAPAGPFSTDAVIATRQATELIPAGTPKARATKLLQKRGFEFSRLKAEPGAGTDHLLIATCTKQKYTWLVGLVIINGRVAASSVTVSKEP